MAIGLLFAHSHKSGFGVLCAQFSCSRIPPLGLSQISVQALCIETFKFVWVVGFGELEGSAGEPHVSGAQKVLARYYDVTLGAVALTESEQPLGLRPLRRGRRVSRADHRWLGIMSLLGQSSDGHTRRGSPWA